MLRNCCSLLGPCVWPAIGNQTYTGLRLKHTHTHTKGRFLNVSDCSPLLHRNSNHIFFRGMSWELRESCALLKEFTGITMLNINFLNSGRRGINLCPLYIKVALRSSENPTLCSQNHAGVQGWDEKGLKREEWERMCRVSKPTPFLKSLMVQPAPT